MPDTPRLKLPIIAFFGCIALAAAQTTRGPEDLSPDTLRAEIQDLRSTLEQIRGELAGLRAETLELRRELDAARQQSAGSHPPPSPPAAIQPDVIPPAEDLQVANAKLDDLYQTKVGSGSKYRVRLSGLALFNAASTRGAVDQIDVPLVAQPVSTGTSEGTFGATLRQSVVSLEVFGPEWKGARTGGELTVDFFGGFPSTPEGVTAGLVRLRTARATLDWKNTSIVAGQDTPFFSPRSPTSLASSAYPALSSAGNLWTWTPQIDVERRWNLTDRSKISITGGILDPLTGELPASEYDRMPTAGESSRMPAYAARLGWQRSAYDSWASVGTGGYYSRQRWQGGHGIDSWAATADWEVPLESWLWLSGELYRGRAIAGLGGGANSSVLFTGPGNVLPVDTAGGWVQLKFKPAQKLEFNSAVGEDHAFMSGGLTLIPGFTGLPIRRNESGMFNVIYQPRSSLLFSVEYRRLRTVWPDGPATADHVNLAAGIVF